MSILHVIAIDDKEGAVGFVSDNFLSVVMSEFSFGYVFKWVFESRNGRSLFNNFVP